MSTRGEAGKRHPTIFIFYGKTNLLGLRPHRFPLLGYHTRSRTSSQIAWPWRGVTSSAPLLIGSGCLPPSLHRSGAVNRKATPENPYSCSAGPLLTNDGGRPSQHLCEILRIYTPPNTDFDTYDRGMHNQQLVIITSESQPTGRQIL